MNVSDYIVERLAAWGVKRVFGYPGDGINGVMGALNRDDHGVRFVQARHEEMAAFMACGHAKFTGQVGVCLATSGPGAIHLLNGLYDAKMDQAPVVAIVGQAARTAIGGDYQQEVDLPSLFKDVAKEYVQTVMAPESARHVIDRALGSRKRSEPSPLSSFPRTCKSYRRRSLRTSTTRCIRASGHRARSWCPAMPISRAPPAS
jgi:pyruvate dehydrogenase (quinone)